MNNIKITVKIVKLLVNLLLKVSEIRFPSDRIFKLWGNFSCRGLKFSRFSDFFCGRQNYLLLLNQNIEIIGIPFPFL